MLTILWTAFLWVLLPRAALCQQDLFITGSGPTEVIAGTAPAFEWSCDATATPQNPFASTLSVEWRLNQTPLPPEKARTEVLPDGNGGFQAHSVLSLPWRDLTTGDNFLDCLATTGVGDAPETVMYLFPINLTLPDLSAPREVIGYKGEALHISCTPSVPGVMVEWYMVVDGGNDTGGQQRAQEPNIPLADATNPPKILRNNSLQFTEILPESFGGAEQVTLKCGALGDFSYPDIPIVQQQSIRLGIVRDGAIVPTCSEVIDSVWGIQWNETEANTTAATSCGSRVLGTATRYCDLNGQWENPQVEECQTSEFAFLFDRVTELLARARERLTEDAVLQILENTFELAVEMSIDDIPIFPRMLGGTNLILSEVVDVLFSAVEQEVGTPRAYVEDHIVATTLSILLNDRTLRGWEFLQRSGDTSSQLIADSAERYGLLVSEVLQPPIDNPEVIIRNNLVMSTAVFTGESPYDGSVESLTFPGDTVGLNGTNFNESIATIRIPQELLLERQMLLGGPTPVVSTLFNNLQQVLPLLAQFNLSSVGAPRSVVISSQVGVQSGQELESLVLQDTPVTMNFTVDLHINETATCVFWNFSNFTEGSGWSVEGVTTEEVDYSTGNIRCSSDHLTSFAVLVDIHRSEEGEEDDSTEAKALRIVSYIGCGVSIACLCLTIIIFLTLKKLFNPMHLFVHLNLALALCLALVVFVAGVEPAAANEVLCKSVAALLQYFLLSAFCWMLCEGIMLYLMLVVVFSTLSKKWWLFCIIGWGIPFVFVAIGLAVAHNHYAVFDSDGDPLYCWISTKDGAIWVFVAPMICVISVNTVFLILVLGVLYQVKQNERKRSHQGGGQHKMVLYGSDTNSPNQLKILPSSSLCLFEECV